MPEMSVILIRNPKTAGTSVAAVLKKLGAWRAGLDGKFPMKKLRKCLGKKACIIVDGGKAQNVYAKLGLLLWKDHVVVSLMRHPFDRVISSWAYAIRKGWIYKSSAPMRVMHTRRKPNFLAWHHSVRPQCCSLFFEEKLIPRFVISFEHLQRDFDMLCDNLGYARVKLPRVNASTHAPWRHYYDKHPQLRPLVERVMAEDLARLPYTFEQDEPTGRLGGTL